MEVIARTRQNSQVILKQATMRDPRGPLKTFGSFTTPRTSKTLANAFPRHHRLALLFALCAIAPTSATFTERSVTGASSPPYWKAITSSGDGTKLAAVQYPGYIWTSSDSGVSWTSRASYQDWVAIASSGDGIKLAAAARMGKIWTSSDSGASWTMTSAASFYTDVAWSGITSSHDGTYLAAVINGGNIYTSSDSGASWTSRANWGWWKGIASSTGGWKLAAVQTDGYIWTSSDYGASWTSRASSQKWSAITSSNDGTQLAAAVYDGNIWTSSDSGVSWTPTASYQSWTAITSSRDGTKLAAVENPGYIWTSPWQGNSWMKDTSIGESKVWRGIASSENGFQLAAVAARGIWTAHVTYCDASAHPTNGDAGDCDSRLVSGAACQPTCNSGYAVSGATSCTDGTLTAATCNLPSSGSSSNDAVIVGVSISAIILSTLLVAFIYITRNKRRPSTLSEQSTTTPPFFHAFLPTTMWASASPAPQARQLPAPQAQQEMISQPRFCANCGTARSEGANFCASCGLKS